MNKPNGEVKPDKRARTYFFSKEELDYLQPRQSTMNMLNIMANGVSIDMQSFVVARVLKRISVDPNQETVNFDVDKGTVTVTPKIVVPTPVIVKR